MVMLLVSRNLALAICLIVYWCRRIRFASEELSQKTVLYLIKLRNEDEEASKVDPLKKTSGTGILCIHHIMTTSHFIRLISFGLTDRYKTGRYVPNLVIQPQVHSDSRYFIL